MNILHKTLLLISVLLPGAGLAHAQDALLKQTVTIQLHQTTVRRFIDSLAMQTAIGFAYDAEALPLDSIVSVNWENTNLKEGLYQLLGSQRVEISTLPRQIVISKNTKTATPIQPNSITVSGKVIDMQTELPLTAVNIGIENLPLGTITNNNGDFTFVVPANLRNQTLCFSMMGYARETIAVKDTVVTIAMTSAQIRLPEVKVMPVSADQIMAKVVERRDQNYLQSSVALTAFFRETVKQNSTYVQASEAVIEVYKPPYDDGYNLERVKFIKGRRNENLPKEEPVQLRLQGGPFYFSRLDIVRYLDFMPAPKSTPIYQYVYEGADWHNGKTMLRVAFSPINDNGDLLYKGEFMIDADTYAVTDIWFEMTKPTLRVSRQYLIKKDSRNFKAKPFYARYHIDYRPYRDMWILNNVKGDIKISVSDKKNNVKAVFEATTEMLVSDLRPIDGERLRYAETFKPDYVLADQIKGNDTTFWLNFNVILPDEELENVFKK